MRMHALRMHAFGIGIGIISNPRSSNEEGEERKKTVSIT